MKRLRYADASLLVGDDLAHAILSYARDLARARTTDIVSVVGQRENGTSTLFQMLVGPSSELIADDAGGPAALAGDAAAITDINARALSVRPPQVRPEAQELSDSAADADAWLTADEHFLT